MLWGHLLVRSSLNPALIQTPPHTRCSAAFPARPCPARSRWWDWQIPSAAASFLMQLWEFFFQSLGFHIIRWQHMPAQNLFVPRAGRQRVRRGFLGSESPRKECSETVQEDISLYLCKISIKLHAEAALSCHWDWWRCLNYGEWCVVWGKTMTRHPVGKAAAINFMSGFVAQLWLQEPRKANSNLTFFWSSLYSCSVWILPNISEEHLRTFFWSSLYSCSVWTLPNISGEHLRTPSLHN